MSTRFIAFVVLVSADLCRAFPQIHANRTSYQRIVGGLDSQQGQFPYHIRLRIYGYGICGGSLSVINGKHVVLTAAHCVTTGTASDYSLVAGDVDRWDVSGNEQYRRVSRIVIHENYKSGGILSNDIAIIFPSQEFELNDNVAPIPLPRQGQETTGHAIITGFGTNAYSGGFAPRILQSVQVPVVGHAACRRSYARIPLTVLPSMICAGGEAGKGSCQGDSGGPVRSVEEGYLAGIVSWGRYCALAGYPAVHTRVSNYINWLNSKV